LAIKNMNLDWQNFAVLLLVAAAAIYLARLGWQSVARRKATACGGCGSCPVNSGGDGKPMVGLEQLAASAKNHAPSEL
jgi:hypothetical protein